MTRNANESQDLNYLYEFHDLVTEQIEQNHEDIIQCQEIITSDTKSLQNARKASIPEVKFHNLQPHYVLNEQDILQFKTKSLSISQHFLGRIIKDLTVDIGNLQKIVKILNRAIINERESLIASPSLDEEIPGFFSEELETQEPQPQPSQSYATAHPHQSIATNTSESQVQLSSSQIHQPVAPSIDSELEYTHIELDNLQQHIDEFSREGVLMGTVECAKDNAIFNKSQDQTSIVGVNDEEFRQEINPFVMAHYKTSQKIAALQKDYLLTAHENHVSLYPLLNKKSNLLENIKTGPAQTQNRNPFNNLKTTKNISQSLPDISSTPDEVDDPLARPRSKTNATPYKSDFSKKIEQYKSKHKQQKAVPTQSLGQSPIKCNEWQDADDIQKVLRHSKPIPIARLPYTINSEQKDQGRKN